MYPRKESAVASRGMFGYDFHEEDGELPPPTRTDLEPEELYKWFQTELNVSTTTVRARILFVRIDSPTEFGARNYFQPKLPAEVVEHSCWKSEVYYDLTKNPGGGAAGLLDNPWRFTLQTPIDGGPFFSLAASRHHVIVKGICFYDDDDFDPPNLTGGELGLKSWPSSGLQLVAVPQMLLQAHSVRLSQKLAKVVDRVKAVETLLVSMAAPVDFSDLSKELHACNTDLMDLERRSRFEQNVIDAIETIVIATKWGTSPWSSVAPQQTAINSRKFDFESLPRRIENARALMSNLIQQRNQELNLEMTEASYRVAEAALSDSKSMKTIAILTMVLLPGTAVASLFSMNLFNWETNDGSKIPSKWLWIYFVIAVPLTVLTLFAWWLWTRKPAVRLAPGTGAQQQRANSTYSDEEADTGVTQGYSGIGLQTTPPPKRESGD